MRIFANLGVFALDKFYQILLILSPLIGQFPLILSDLIGQFEAMKNNNKALLTCISGELEKFFQKNYKNN